MEKLLQQFIVFFLNYETKFLISLIFKKISKDNLKKNINFDKKKKKRQKM